MKGLVIERERESEKRHRRRREALIETAFTPQQYSDDNGKYSAYI